MLNHTKDVGKANKTKENGPFEMTEDKKYLFLRQRKVFSASQTFDGLMLFFLSGIN